MTKQVTPAFDGKMREYGLELDNGASAVVRTFGGNVYSYKTKEGIEVLGTRRDAVDINSDSKPYAGGVPHCFPQVSIFITSTYFLLISILM
jgi:D-hexose-6-phosphate mutarotase